MQQGITAIYKRISHDAREAHNKINILFISPSTAYYGSERCLMELISALDHEKYGVHLFVPPNSSYLSYAPANLVTISEVDMVLLPVPHNYCKVLKFNLFVISYVFNKKVKIIHINLLKYPETMFLFTILLKWLGVTVIYHKRSAEDLNWFQRFVVMRGYLICVSDALRERFLRSRRSDFLTRPSLEKVMTVYDGKCLEQFASNNRDSSVKTSLGLKSKYVVGMVAAIDRRKRQDLFIHIAHKLRMMKLDVQFILIGDVYLKDSIEGAAFKSEIQKLVKDCGLEKDVQFLGYRTDCAKLIKVMDVFLLTSTSDPLPGVIIEAMASGVPVVANAVDGIPEMIVDGETGLLVRTDSVDEYAEKIAQLINNPVRLQRMGEAAQNRAQAIFTISQYVKNMDRAFESCMGNRR